MYVHTFIGGLISYCLYLILSTRGGWIPWHVHKKWVHRPIWKLCYKAFKTVLNDKAFWNPQERKIQCHTLPIHPWESLYIHVVQLTDTFVDYGRFLHCWNIRSTQVTSVAASDLAVFNTCKQLLSHSSEYVAGIHAIPRSFDNNIKACRVQPSLLVHIHMHNIRQWILKATTLVLLTLAYHIVYPSISYTCISLTNIPEQHFCQNPWVPALHQHVELSSKLSHSQKWSGHQAWI